MRYITLHDAITQQPAATRHQASDAQHRARVRVQEALLHINHKEDSRHLSLPRQLRPDRFHHIPLGLLLGLEQSPHAVINRA